LEVIENTPHFRFVEKGYREGENVYAALGRTDAGRYLPATKMSRSDAAPQLPTVPTDVVNTEFDLPTCERLEPILGAGIMGYEDHCPANAA
jgi:hypothetical protein